ncbi:Uncharacterized protein TCM_015622 [Theobroma cacao]|uniref:Uncharacterized protein n=1 Tax=Theobroma cacao TaxID=3641 RepID=A0A061G390_THECC|nr:Uncharacterized protein TCM_015622 [Theobroma cacao]
MMEHQLLYGSTGTFPIIVLYFQPKVFLLTPSFAVMVSHHHLGTPCKISSFAVTTIICSFALKSSIRLPYTTPPILSGVVVGLPGGYRLQSEPTHLGPQLPEKV